MPSIRDSMLEAHWQTIARYLFPSSSSLRWELTQDHRQADVILTEEDEREKIQERHIGRIVWWYERREGDSFTAAPDDERGTIMDYVQGQKTVTVTKFATNHDLVAAALAQPDEFPGFTKSNITISNASGVDDGNLIEARISMTMPLWVKPPSEMSSFA